MGGRGSGGVRNSSTQSYKTAVEQLTTPKGELIFADSKISPLTYDGSQIMKVNFGGWQKQENLVGVQEIPVKDIVTTQPYVQSNKLLNFGGPIDTSEVPVLQIGDKYYVADGNHRVVSNVLAGKKRVRVKVYREE